MPFFTVGMTLEFAGLRHAARLLWLLGYPDQALQKSQDSMALARELSHPSTSGFRAVLLRLVPSTPW